MPQHPPLIAPSLLAADFLKVGEEVEMVNRSEAGWLHLDIMDGRFVPNISFGLPVVAAVKRVARKPLDVHLMISEPGRYAAAFREAGADHLTVHLEACPQLHRDIAQIHALGMKAGVAINPHTPVALLADIIGDVDIVNVMTVDPGFGGQAFIPHSMEKIRELRRLIDERASSALIEIDGGVSADNAADIVGAGAEVLVAGSNVFRATEPEQAVRQLLGAGRKGWH